MTIKKILFATDFSEQATDAATHALSIGKHTGAELVVAHAMTTPSIDFALPYAVETPGLSPEQTKEIFDGGRKRLHEAAEILRGQGASVTESFVEDVATRGIARIADESKADLIVMGTHGRGRVARFFLGSVAQWIATHADCDILAARGPVAEGGYKRILVPTDFSPYSVQALERAIELVAPGGAIDLVHYWRIPMGATNYWGELREGMRTSIREGSVSHGEKLIESYSKDDLSIRFTADEQEARQGIVERMESGDYDLVVMGSHGLHGVKKLILGSVADAVLRHTKHSVYIARAKDE